MKIIRKYGYKHLVFWVLFVFVFNFVFFPVSILAKENSGLEAEVFLPGITKNEISEAENFELEVILDEGFKHLPENPNRPWEVLDTLHIPVTAYNAGDINQCWGDPCISANGENICLALEKGYRRCAANFVPLGTRLNIEGFGDCLVTDRMNERYHYRVDIAMKLDEKQKAKEFGIKKLKVEIVK
ncbi:MAG: 3D domain-containing protein [Candidatus Pacebacteria bacterium]|nr:3D domain-containing protein [Candidatus Paceibacterota bacterium]